MAGSGWLLAQRTPKFITSDIDRFWKAFDKVQSTSDTSLQVNYLNKIFYKKASKGQKKMFEVRGYTAEEYVEAINRYPGFWKSIRPNMIKAKDYARSIQEGVENLSEIYQLNNTGNVYFTVGVFRSPGTTFENMVLIGSEFALGDKDVFVDEFPEDKQYVVDYFKTNPVEGIVFLNVHEFVHTQQKTAFGSYLLTQCLREGVAEFVAEKVSDKPSLAAAIPYTKANLHKVKEAFEKDLFNWNYTFWLWGPPEAQFATRDMGYGVGYTIAEKYYDLIPDKKQALKTLIELDYGSDSLVMAFVDSLDYFSQPLSYYKKMFEANRPEVVSIEEFSNNDQQVDAGLTKITLLFVRPMDSHSVGLDYGPLGEDHVVDIKKLGGFNEDRTSFSMICQLEPGQHYQLLISSGFSCENGHPLKPYLIDFKTAD